MSPGDLLATLEGYRIQVFIKDGFLRYRSPVGAFNSALRGEVRRQRQTLITEWMCCRCQRITRIFVGFPPDICCLECFGGGADV